jgi:hypothetical protein
VTLKQQTKLEQLTIEYHKADNTQYIEVIQILIKSYLTLSTQLTFLLKILPVGLNQAQANSERQSVHQVYFEFERPQGRAKSETEKKEVTRGKFQLCEPGGVVTSRGEA